MIAPIDHKFQETLPPVASLLALLVQMLYNEKPTPGNRRVASDICEEIHKLEPATFIIWENRFCHILEVKEAILEGI